MGLGCGNPQSIAALKEGETVLDLGAGGGFDSFLAAKQRSSPREVLRGTRAAASSLLAPTWGLSPTSAPFLGRHTTEQRNPGRE